eukprot:gnl/Chilomastix_caulleri/6965.p1 GENE.gnl/Chilomastix_caulleri/6965~~gnl/Chilomastix_caulleri/6965.p1  ORF type:complete len:84 (+),score=6.10 gnl/Chilomastix_caulleri/6965:162-413(+)
MYHKLNADSQRLSWRGNIGKRGEATALATDKRKDSATKSNEIEKQGHNTATTTPQHLGTAQIKSPAYIPQHSSETNYYPCIDN